MSPSEKTRVQECVQELSEILYRNTPSGASHFGRKPKEELTAWIDLRKSDRIVERTTKLIDEPSSSNSRNSQASSRSSATSENQSQDRHTPTEIRERDSSEVTNEDINNAIDAVMDFNDAPNRPHKQKFRLSVKPISDLTNRANNSVSKILKERSEEIESHHEQHQISAYHNKSRKDERDNFYPPIESEPEIDYQRLTEVTTDLD